MSLKDASFNYIKDYKYDYIDVELKNDLGRNGCKCTDNCRDKFNCSCWQLTIERLLGWAPTQYDYNVNATTAYKNMRLMEIVYTGIVECGSSCGCCPQKCVNRVVQNGLQHKLELFETKNRGWGVRATNDIPEAVFVCNYSGDVLVCFRFVWFFLFLTFFFVLRSFCSL